MAQAPERPGNLQDSPAPNDAAGADANNESTSDSFFRNFDAVVVACIVIGLAFASAGYFELRHNSGINQFVLVMGLGFLFGALGATARIGNKVWSMSGGAAIGVILGLFLNSWIGQNFDTVQLRALPKSANLIASAADENIPQVLKLSSDRKTRTAKLILTEENFKSGILSFHVTVPALRKSMRCVDSQLIREALLVSPSSGWKIATSSDGSTHIHSETGTTIARVEDCETLEQQGAEFTFECVEASLIQKALTTTGQASLLLKTSEDHSTGQLELNGEYIAKFPTPTSKNDENLDHCQEMRKRLANKQTASLDINSWVRSFKNGFTAFASDGVSPQILIEELQSEDTITRRNARFDLAKQGLAAVEPMMQAFEQKGPLYRTRLGVLVAINKFLLDNPGKNEEVSKRITDEQLNQIARYAGDRGATIRNYAQIVLSRLDDSRATPMLLRSLKGADRTAVPSLLELLKGEVVSQTVQNKQVTELNVTATLRGKDADPSFQTIAKQIEAISAGKAEAADKRFFVMTGTFSTRKAAESWKSVINKRNPPAPAMVVAPRPGENLFRVVVGEYVDAEEAKKLKEALLTNKTVSEAYLSNYPFVPLR